MIEKQNYSFVYAINLFHLICWIHILFGTILYFLSMSFHFAHFVNSDTIFKFVILILKITQTLQFTDMLFSLLKITKGSTFGSFLQVTGRNYIVWLILSSHHHSNIVLALILFNWSIADIVRYLYYVLPNNFTLFLRYNAFLLNYPLGITGEIWSVIENIDGIDKTKNPEWLYFLQSSVIVLAVGFLFLFNYMLSARRSALKKIKEKKP